MIEADDDVRPEEPLLRDLFRRTWELELLISGALAFALTWGPGALDRGFERLAVHLDKDLFLLAFYGYVYPKLIAITLIVTFVVHLAARAYWVGLIGLQSVFPAGVRWSELRFGPNTVGTYRRTLPSLAAMAKRTDAFCSVLIASIVVLSLGIVFWDLMGSTGAGLHGSQFLPMAAGELAVDHDHYRDRRDVDTVYRTTPSIQSVMVDDGWLELRLPYYGRRDDPIVAALCPDVQPLSSSRIMLRPPRPDPPPAERLGTIRDCLGTLAAVRVDWKVRPRGYRKPGMLPA